MEEAGNNNTGIVVRGGFVPRHKQRAPPQIGKAHHSTASPATATWEWSGCRRVTPQQRGDTYLEKSLLRDSLAASRARQLKKKGNKI